MTELDIAWLSGWLEGEGYFGIPHGSPTICVCSTDSDVVEKAAKLMNSNVTIAKKRTDPNKVHYKQIYRTFVRGVRAIAVMNMIRSYMGTRRGNTIDVAIAHYSGKEERYSNAMKRRWANPTYRNNMLEMMKKKGSEKAKKAWKTRKSKLIQHLVLHSSTLQDTCTDAL